MSVTTTGGGVLYAPAQELQQSAFGELVVASVVPFAAWRFDYTINPQLYTATTANGGTVTVDANRAKLTTSTANNGSASVQTLRRCRYIPSVGGIATFTAVFATGTANSQQIIGPGDGVDGFFFGYNGSSFGIMRRRNSVDTWVASGSWNGTALTMTLDQTKGNIYKIVYQWLGYGAIKFYIFDATLRTYVLVHTIDYANSSADVHTLNPSFPLFAEIKNTGNTSSLSMYSPSGMVGLQGDGPGPNVLGVHRGASGTVTLSDTNNNHILSIKNDTLIGAQTSRVPIRITKIVMSRENNAVKTATFRLYRDATTAGARTYAAVDATHSPVQTSTTATTISGGTVRLAVVVPAGAPAVVLDYDDELMLQPGEILTIACQDSSATSTDVAVSVEYEELF